MNWITRVHPYVTFIGAVFGIVGGVLGTLAFLSSKFQWTDPNYYKIASIIVFGAHVLLCAIVVTRSYNYNIDEDKYTDLDKAEFKEVFFFLKNITELRELLPRAIIHVDKLLKYCVYICGTWGIFYLIEGINEAFNGNLFGDTIYYRSFFNLFNAFETCFFYFGLLLTFC